MRIVEDRPVMEAGRPLADARGRANAIVVEIPHDGASTSRLSERALIREDIDLSLPTLSDSGRASGGRARGARGRDALGESPQVISRVGTRRLPCFALALICILAIAGTASAGSPLRSRPARDGPLPIDVDFRLRDLNSVDEESETFGFAGVVRMVWRDERQAFDPDEFGSPVKEFGGTFQIEETFLGWKPQLVLANQVGDFDRQASVLRIMPDGTLILVESFVAVAKSRMDLRRFPFDAQRFEAVFHVLGHGANEVELVHEHRTLDFGPIVGETVSQWETPTVNMSTRDIEFRLDGRTARASAFVLQLDMERKPLFMLRLTALPIGVLVILSWSVFWMDRSSVGERMDVSFMGILTSVAYQIVFSDTLPKISYVTLSSAFLFVSFLAVSATVFVNLRVSQLDREGRAEDGDRLDRICRVAFPAGYFAFIGLTGIYFFLFR